MSGTRIIPNSELITKENSLIASSDTESSHGSPDGSPQSPPGSSKDAPLPPFELEKPAIETTMHIQREVSLRRVGSASENLVLSGYLDSDDEDDLEEKKEEKWSGNRNITFQKELYKKGILAMKEPFTDAPSQPVEQIVDDTSFTFGSSRFQCDTRSTIEKKFPDKATKKAFIEAEAHLKKITDIRPRPNLLTKTLTTLLKDSYHGSKNKSPHPIKSKSSTTQNILGVMHEEQKAIQLKDSDLINLIKEYDESSQDNTTAVYRQPSGTSYDPLVLLPFKIHTNSKDDAVGLKVSAWASGGTANNISIADIEAFRAFYLAICIFGTSVVGLDKNGGFISIVKHDIAFFQNQKVIGIKVLGSSLYEAIQFEIFRRAILPLMQQIGRKNEKHLELKSTMPADDELKPFHLSLYVENKQLYLASLVDNKPCRMTLEKSNFSKHSDHYQNLLEAMANPPATLNDKTKDKLFEIAMSHNIFPKDFKVVIHLPYIDYIMFGVRLYVEGLISKQALGVFCYEILKKAEKMRTRLDTAFPKGQGIELEITSPLENLFDTAELSTIYNQKQESQTKYTKADELSNFILNQLGLSTNENDYAIDDSFYHKHINSEHTTEERDAIIKEKRMEIIEERQSKIVNHLLTLLTENKYNPLQAIVWHDFSKAAAAMGNTPKTLEELFKIGNAVVIGAGSHKMKPNTACSIQPYSEKPIQTTFDKFSQKANEFSATLLSIPEGKEAPSEIFEVAEKTGTPILIQKVKVSLPEAILKNAQENNTPILIKKGDDYSVHGYIEGQWQETKLDSLSRAELTTLNKLKPQDSKIKSDDLQKALLEILKKGHTPDLAEKPDIHYVTLVDEYSIYGVKDNRWQETKLPSLAKDKQITFNKLIKQDRATIANDELKPFVDVIKNGHTPEAVYPYVVNFTYLDPMAFDLNNPGSNPHVGITFYYPDVQNKAVDALRHTSFIFNGLRNGARSEQDALPLQQDNARPKRR